MHSKWTAKQLLANVSQPPLSRPPIFQTEQIRRQNRLYASDSLFVKPYLMIPVAKGSPHYPPETTTTSPNAVPDSHRWPHSTLFPEDQSYTGPWDPLQGGPQPGPSHSMDLPSTSSSSASPSSTPTPVNAPPAECLSPEEEQKKDLDELLGKIDSTIASSRRFVAKSQDSSDFAVVSEENEDHLDGHYYDGAYQNASSTTHMRNLSSGSGNFHTADDTSNLITNTRQVKSTMRRLEQTQDELFEL